MDRWRARARNLKQEVTAVYIAARDPRTPWYARLLAAGIIAYALSPLDLIPDPIPVLGYLDDLILLPLAILLVLRLIPEDAMADAHSRAADSSGISSPAGWAGTGIIVLLWILLVGLAIYLAMRLI